MGMRPIIETRPFVRDDGETEISVEFSYQPGTPERGRFGPPEDYDPGSGPEIELVAATVWSAMGSTPSGQSLDPVATDILDDLTEAEEERIMDEIAQNPPEPDDDPDLYTQRKDERATGGRHDD